ncbi:MAG: molecular chaperone DnaJ [bacterium]
MLETEIIHQDSVNTIESVINTTHTITYDNIWMWIAIVEFLIILIFCLTRIGVKKRNLKSKVKKEILSDPIDFDNIIKSSFHANELYDKLIKKCHPDRFPTDQNLNNIATELSKEIQKNRTNLNRLNELKIEAQTKLNINI